MDYMGFFNYLISDSLFTFVIILVAFIFGWLLYTKLILKDISLKDALFEKDCLAVWVEFIGAFIFPVLFLAAEAVIGSASRNLIADLLICTGYALIYIVIFTLLRMGSNSAVKLICPDDCEGRITLNNEIYNQHNISASLFSVTLSVISVSVIRQFDFLGGMIAVSLEKMVLILAFSVIAFAVYTWFLRRTTNLMKEIFIDNNPAAGFCFLGFVYAIEIILSNAIAAQKDFNLPELLIVSVIGLLIFGVFSVLLRYILTKIIKIDFLKEVYEQNNFGAALGQVALYIGIASVIVNYLK